MPRYFNHHYGKRNLSVLSNDTYTCSWSENMIRCFNSTERLKQLNRSKFCVKCEVHYGENEKYCSLNCRNRTPCGKFLTAQLYDASIIEINSKKYILSKFICSSIITDPNADRVVYNMKKALLFNYEPDFKPKLNDNNTITYKWYQVGSIDRITKEIIWESN